MNIPRKQVCYRVAGGPCMTGYESGDCDAPTVEIYTHALTGTLVAGAVVVPCGDCPAEVFVVNQGTTPVPTAGVAFDREVTQMCSPTTGSTVFVVTLWDQAAVPGQAPTVEAFNQDGTPYVGAISALVKCATTTVDVETLDQVVCAGGSTYTHSTFVDTATLSTVGSLWRDASGAVVAAPAGPFTLGACEPVQATVQVTLASCSSGEAGPRSSPVQVSADPPIAVFTPMNRPLMVKTCQTMGHHAQTDWCDPTTGDPVVVVSWWRDAADQVTAPMVTAYNLDGSTYGGDIMSLVKCRSIPTAPRAVQVRFRDLATGASLTGAALLAALPAGAVLTSVAVRQRSGYGTAAGDDAVAVQLEPGESWAWNADTGSEDSLLSPSFDLSAGTGTMRVVTMFRV